MKVLSFSHSLLESVALQCNRKKKKNEFSFGFLLTYSYLCHRNIKRYVIMRSTTVYPQTNLSPVDALWTLIQGQSRNVRTILSRLLHEQQVATEINLSKAFDRLDHLATLEDGWAGKGSYAISPQVLDNLRSVLFISDDADWRDWMIGPDVNATLGLQSKKSGGSISLGADEFSYYASKDGKEFHESHVPFSSMSLLEVMRKIA